MIKSKWFWIVLIVAALIAAGAVWQWRQRLARTPGEQPLRVERGDLSLAVMTTGVAQPQNRLEIKPPIAGRVEDVLVQEGDPVRKGQILAWMSSTERAALLDAARAKGETELAYWEQLYKPAPLVAPLDGNIIARKVEPGQAVTASDALFVMSDRLIVEAQVDETDIGQVVLGQPAAITLDAYPTDVISGKVDQIAYEAKIVNNVTMYMVDILPAQVPAFLRSGMTANIKIVTAVTNGVLLLPAEAVFAENGRSFVRVAQPEGKNRPTKRTIITGLTDGKQVEIRSGLREGDAVLVTQSQTPGSKEKPASNPFMPFGRRR